MSVEKRVLKMNTTIRAILANDPYLENERIRCDCFLTNLDGQTPTDPPALIQLISGTIKQPLNPNWKEKDVVLLQPTLSAGWNDTQGSGRCYLELAIYVTCEGHDGFLM